MPKPLCLNPSQGKANAVTPPQCFCLWVFHIYPRRHVVEFPLFVVAVSLTDRPIIILFYETRGRPTLSPLWANTTYRPNASREWKNYNTCFVS